MLSARALHDRLELGGRAEHRGAPARNLLVRGREGVDVADRLEAELRTLVEPALHLGADPAGADDERALGDDALLPRAALGYPQDVSAPRRVHHAERPDPGDQLGLPRSAPREEGDRGDDDHRRDGARAHDMPHLVEVLHGDLLAVHAPDRQECHDRRREDPNEPRRRRVDVRRVCPDEGRDDREDEHQPIRDHRGGRPGPPGEEPPGPRRDHARRLWERVRLGRSLDQPIIGECKLLSSALTGSRHQLIFPAHYRGGHPECLARTRRRCSRGQASSDRLSRRMPKPIASSTPPAAATKAMSRPVNGSCPPLSFVAA